MTLQIHPKDREAFVELQTKMIDTNRLLNQVNMKIQIADREKRRAQLTLKELDSITQTNSEGPSNLLEKCLFYLLLKTYALS